MEVEASWSDIWKAAIAAYCVALVSGNPMAAFAEVAKRFEADPMVSYERGEAFEGIDRRAEAAADYERALAFPAPQWKRVAMHSLTRVRSGSAYIADEHDYRAEALHRAHTFFELGPKRLHAILSAIHGAGSQPKQTLAAVRRELELIVEDLLSRNNLAKLETFRESGRLLRETGVIESDLELRMNDLWSQCNRQHGREPLVMEIHETIEEFLALLEALQNRDLLK